MTGPATEAGPQALVASLFRHESGRLVAALVRLFGPHNLELAEDVVQEALETALQAWKFHIPDNPSAWLNKVARNRALDVIRHSGIERRYADEFSACWLQNGRSRRPSNNRWPRPVAPKICCA